MSGSGNVSLDTLGLNINAAQPQSPSNSQRRATIGPSAVSGAVTGLHYDSNGQNITVIGGHFSATASNGSTINNLLILNNTANQEVTGLAGAIDSSSTILSMDTQGSSLYAGGTVTGNVNGNAIDGLLVYDLSAGTLNSTQPPALSGPSVTVNAVAAQPSATSVFVGGDFSSAGSLPCQSLCMWDTEKAQWNVPGSNFGGVVSSLTWSSNTQLVIAGNLTLGGNATTMATYDSKTQTFSPFNGASTLPGPVTALAAADSDYSQFWAAGLGTNGAGVFLEKYDGTKWTAATGLGSSSVIRGLRF